MWSWWYCNTRDRRLSNYWCRADWHEPGWGLQALSKEDTGAWDKSCLCTGFACYCHGSPHFWILLHKWLHVALTLNLLFLLGLSPEVSRVYLTGCCRFLLAYLLGGSIDWISGLCLIRINILPVFLEPSHEMLYFGVAILWGPFHFLVLFDKFAWAVRWGLAILLADYLFSLLVQCGVRRSCIYFVVRFLLKSYEGITKFLPKV